MSGKGNPRHTGGVASAMQNLNKMRTRQLLVEALDTINQLLDPYAKAPNSRTDIVQRLEAEISRLDMNRDGK